MEKISNYNSISTIIDRLVIERVKQAQFEDKGYHNEVELQKRLAGALKVELSNALNEIFKYGYESIKEERTFK